MTARAKIVWLLLAALWLVAFGRMLLADVPPEPPAPVIVVNLSQGAGARALLKHKPTAQTRVLVFPWRYEQAYTNVWFNLEASADLKSWVCVRSNVTGEVTVTNAGERFRGFRLKGRFTP